MTIERYIEFHKTMPSWPSSLQILQGRYIQIFANYREWEFRKIIAIASSAGKTSDLYQHPELFLHFLQAQQSVCNDTRRGDQ